MLVTNAALTEHAKAIRKLGKQTVENVIEIGRHLTEAKAEVKKLGGSWADWLKQEFDWNEISARRFMAVFECKSELDTVSDADLPLRTLYLLAAPGTSRAAREEVTNRTRNGEKLKHKEVAAVVKKHKRTGRRPVSGVVVDIETAIRNAGERGMSSDELKVRFEGKHHPQTVNSATNSLAKRDRIQDSGKRRQGRAAGGRPAVVYVYNPDPKPKKTAKVIDFDKHKSAIAKSLDLDGIVTLLATKTKGMRHEDKIELGVKILRKIGVSAGQVYNRDLALCREEGLVTEISFGRVSKKSRRK